MAARRRPRLLNPGPVTVTERVRESQLGPDLCHREPEYAALQADVRERLAGVYPEAADSYSAVLITGSGTAAVECMVDSLVPSSGKALVVANGIYGERMAAILQAHRKPFELLRSEWTRPMDVEAVESRLTQDASITQVLAVHHETTTGRLNDLASLGRLCRRFDVPLLLDTVSSFGGEVIAFDEWNIAACAATANKCLHGIPGTSFVLARRDTLINAESAATSLYLDLFGHWHSQQQMSTRFTPSVQSMYALQMALKELETDGGWESRRAHYRSLSARLRERLAELGCSLLLEDADACSAVLTSFNLPAGVDFDSLYYPLKDFGFVIYPGQKELRSRIFRVAVMGDLRATDIDEFAEALATRL